MALDLLTTIELDMQNPYSSSSIVHVNQYDTAGRIKAQLLNGGVKWQVPQGAKPVVMFKKTDNIGGFYDVTELNPSTAAVTVDGNDSSIIYITLDQQTTTTATPTGQYVNMQVAFYQNGARLSTFAFHMQVAESVVTSGDIHSNWLFNILSQEIAQILTDATTPEFIENWLENNITQETGYVIDDSLTIHGAASDAQATGKMVTVSDTNPGVVANKVWVKKTPSEIVVPTEDEVEDLRNTLSSAEQVIVNSTFHQENVESGFVFSLGDINTNTGAKIQTIYAAITGYRMDSIEDSYFGMSTDDYYYRIAYTKSNVTGTDNVIFVTDYVIGTTKTNIKYANSQNYKVIVVKDPTGTISMEDNLTDVQSKCRYYKNTPYELDTSLALSGKAAESKTVGDILFQLKSDVGRQSEYPVDSYSDFINAGQTYLYDGTRRNFSNLSTTDFIECAQGQNLKFKLYGFNATVSGNLIILATIAFFDANKTFLSSVYYPETTKGIVWEEEITVPENAVYFKALTDDSLVADPFVSISATGLYKDVEDLQDAVGIKTTVKIAFIGDSLTQGLTGGATGSYTFADKPYPTIFKEYLINHGFDVTVKNYGRRGLSAKSYWNNAIPVNSEWHNPKTGEPGDAINFDNTFDAVIIMLGVNGSLENNTIEQDTAITEEQTYLDYADTQCGDYCKIIEYVMEHTDNHAQIILVASPYALAESHTQKMIDTVATIKALGARYQLPVIDSLNFSGLGPFNGPSKFYNTTDWLHFTQAGYHKLGTFIASQFSSLYSTFDISELT